jgi:hypothetical protein
VGIGGLMTIKLVLRNYFAVKQSKLQSSSHLLDQNSRQY